MLFQIRNLSKTYGNRTVLDISELDLRKGIIYALVGPNGAGKTTLLEILSFLDYPTTGKVIYNNKPVDFSGRHLHNLRREIVLVQQNPVLFTTTVYKNLEFGLKIREISRDERDKIIEESLDLVGMRDFINAQAHKLSGGETQRVAIARALSCSPNVILFDEPTANVDFENQVAIEHILTQINTQKNISVMFTSHNQIQATRLSHEMASLFEGRLTPLIFENIYGGNIISEKEHPKVCLIQNRIQIVLDTDKTGPVRLSINPLKIQMLRVQDTQFKENVFSGKLIQLSDENDYVRAVVDIGIPLNILVNRSKPSEYPMIIGQEVHIFCPKEAIQTF